MKQIFLLFFFISGTLSGQSDYEEEYLKAYAENIKKEFINDIYIPKSFEDAFDELKRLTEPGTLEKFKNASEETVSKKLHFGLGRWMAVNWNFEGGSRLSHQMKEMGVSFPDDMVQLMIVSFHRHLNGKTLLLEQQAMLYYEKRKKENEERLKRANVLNQDNH